MDCEPPKNYWSEAILPPISHFLLQFNSSLNFFVYSFLNKTFRSVLKERFFKFLKIIHAPKLCYCVLNRQEEVENTNQLELQSLTGNQKFSCQNNAVADSKIDHNPMKI